MLAPNYLYDSSMLSICEDFGSGSTALRLNKGTKSVDVDDTKPEVAGEINPKNQLPPMVQVTMVALDEASAQRLMDKSGNDALAY